MRKLAIVGSAPNAHTDVPFDDPEFDIWVLNEAANREWCKRWSACFQMHEPEIYTGHNTKDPHHWEWLQKKHNKPIYMQEIDPRVPDSVTFPLQEAIDLVGFQYLSSTIAMACALAALQKYEHVEFYAIELSVTEYKSQREGYGFWVGFLKGRLGAEHVNHNFTHLGKNIFNAPLYGYEGSYAFGKDYFSERVKQLDAEWQSADKHAQNMIKAISRAIKNQEVSKLPALIQSYQSALSECGAIAGRLAEAERYQMFGDRYADRGGFEYAAAKAQRDGEERRIQMYVALGKAEYVWNVWAQTKNSNAANQLINMIDTVGKLAQETGAMFGMFQENADYIMKYDNIVQAGGKALLENL